MRVLWRSVVLLVATMLAACVLIDKGILQIPLPHPANEFYAHGWPHKAYGPDGKPAVGDSISMYQQAGDVLIDDLLSSHGRLTDMGEATAANKQRRFEMRQQTVSVDPVTGWLLLPDKWGDVHQAVLLADGSYQLNPVPLAQLGPGRVLGSKIDQQGNLIMCDVLKGLLRLNVTSRRLEQLSSRVSSDSPNYPDSPIYYANSLDIAANGSIFFTSSTDILPARARDGSYDTGFAWALNLFRSLPRGRVLVYHPHTRRTHVVASGFFYSDGLAVSADGSYLLVVETDALRVTKVWLSGEKAGTRERLVDLLPGMPAGLSKASDGNFWVSMTTPVPRYGKWLHSRLVRTLIAWAPRSWRPPVKVWGAVVKISPEGRMINMLLDPTGARVATASAATEHNGRLFLGSILGGPFISYVDLPAIQQQLDAQAAASMAAVNDSGAAAAAAAELGSFSPDQWHEVGGWSLHEQQELWGAQAAGRTKKV